MSIAKIILSLRRINATRQREMTTGESCCVPQGNDVGENTPVITGFRLRMCGKPIERLAGTDPFKAAELTGLNRHTEPAIRTGQQSFAHQSPSYLFLPLGYEDFAGLNTRPALFFPDRHAASMAGVGVHASIFLHPYRKVGERKISELSSCN